jgi:hypothetical protein
MSPIAIPLAARDETFMVTVAPALVAVLRELRPADAALRECLTNGCVRYKLSGWAILLDANVFGESPDPPSTIISCVGYRGLFDLAARVA